MLVHGTLNLQISIDRLSPINELYHDPKSKMQSRKIRDKDKKSKLYKILTHKHLPPFIALEDRLFHSNFPSSCYIKRYKPETW